MSQDSGAGMGRKRTKNKSREESIPDVIIRMALRRCKAETDRLRDENLEAARANAADRAKTEEEEEAEQESSNPITYVIEKDGSSSTSDGPPRKRPLRRRPPRKRAKAADYRAKTEEEAEQESPNPSMYEEDVSSSTESERESIELPLNPPPRKRPLRRCPPRKHPRRKGTEEGGARYSMSPPHDDTQLDFPCRSMAASRGLCSDKQRVERRNPWLSCNGCGYKTFVNKHYWNRIGIRSPMSQGFCVHCNDMVPGNVEM